LLSGVTAPALAGLAAFCEYAFILLAGERPAVCALFIGEELAESPPGVSELMFCNEELPIGNPLEVIPEKGTDDPEAEDSGAENGALIEDPPKAGVSELMFCNEELPIGNPEEFMPERVKEGSETVDDPGTDALIPVFVKGALIEDPPNAGVPGIL
jgi:hypothetical protein